MADRKRQDIAPNIRPDFIAGGGQAKPDKANLQAVNDQENNPQAPASGSVPQREEEPEFENNFTGDNKSKATKMSFGNLRSLFKRKGPSGLIIGLIMGGGLGGLSLGGLGLLPFHIAEQFLEKFDTQNTSFTIRTNKIIANKLTSDLTEGCGIIKITCRFSKPSNKLLRNMEANGITAYDKAGDKIEPKKGIGKFLPDKRPHFYSFRDQGRFTSLQKTPAKEFAAKIRSDPKIRAAFHKAYNPRFVSLSSLSTAFKTVKARFGFDGRNTLSTAGDSGDEEKKTPQEKLNERAAGTDNGSKAAADGGGNGQNILRKLISEKITKLFDNIAKSGKGSLATLIAGGVCAVTDIPGVIAKTARAYQLIQLVRYGAAIMNAIYAMKAGDATAADASFIGTLLTQSVDGRSPMDAFGMKYTLFGDTKPENDNYKKFAPGGNVINSLRSTTNITDSAALNSTCAVATSPEAGVTLNAALLLNSGETLGVTAVIALLNYAAGEAFSALMSAALPGLISYAVDNIPGEWIQGLLKFFFGDLTENLVGEPVGDALPSAISHELGQVANAGGNMTLTIPQAIAYSKVTQEVQLAYAEEDRATLSPFDASNSNTFLGSIVNQFLPYYDNLASIGGVVSMVGNLFPKSLGSILQPVANAAKDPTAEYMLCDDPALEGTAAGPFCNPYYGIPPEYLDIDPQKNLDKLIADKDINEETGEPLDREGGLKDWLALCADGSTDNIEGCKITDADDGKYARFAIYTIDHVIQQSMDEEVEATGGITEDGSSTQHTGSSLEVVVNKKHPNDPQDYVPSGLVDIGSGYMLRSEAATAYALMASAAASAGHTLIPISAYRSYSKQVEVYGGWVNDLGQEAADLTSARPGYSEHQTGLAVDLNSLEQSFAGTGPGQWLAANSYQYGFVLRFPNGKTPVTGYEFEPWHYRYIGIEPATDMHNKGVTTLEEYYNVTGGDYAYIRTKNDSLASFLEYQNKSIVVGGSPTGSLSKYGWLT